MAIALGAQAELKPPTSLDGACRLVGLAVLDTPHVWKLHHDAEHELKELVHAVEVLGNSIDLDAVTVHVPDKNPVIHHDFVVYERIHEVFPALAILLTGGQENASVCGTHGRQLERHGHGVFPLWFEGEAARTLHATVEQFGGFVHGDNIVLICAHGFLVLLAQALSHKSREVLEKRTHILR